MDDMISRKAAIDALEREKTYSAVYKYGYTQADYFKQYNMGLTDGIKALNKLPSVQPQRWIPVTERLPDRYIVGGDGKHYSQDVLMTVIYRDDDIFIDYGQMVDDEWYSEMDKEIITSPFEVVAWMPLPEPYKERTDENH